MRALFGLFLVAACGSSASSPDALVHKLDSAPRDGALIDAALIDARAIDAALVDAHPDAHVPDAGPDLDAGQPYRHTITIDGTDDFALTEHFGTTSATYGADLAWDDDNIYIGYTGDDIAGATGGDTKWVFAFVDADPGASTGAMVGPVYNTQFAMFPTGFGAEYYLRWKADGTFATIEQYAGGAWTTSATTPVIARNGMYVEMAFPRSLLGGANVAGIVTYMINEAPFAESSYAGLYAGNFTDGYAPGLVVTKYLRADFTATRTPNDPANVAP